jgi:hypothetical protein
MKQITMRRVGEQCLAEARRLARERGVAMNTVLVEALERGLGLAGERRTNGLEKFAGDSDFGPDWGDRMRELERIDPEGWR